MVENIARLFCILTVEEACEVLHISYNAIFALLGNSKLRGYRNGRVWRIPKESVKKFILENAGL